MVDPLWITQVFTTYIALADATQIDGVVTVVDCKSVYALFRRYLSRELEGKGIEVVWRQMATADKVILNKADDCAQEDL